MFFWTESPRGRPGKAYFIYTHWLWLLTDRFVGNQPNIHKALGNTFWKRAFNQIWYTFLHKQLYNSPVLHRKNGYICHLKLWQKSDTWQNSSQKHPILLYPRARSIWYKKRHSDPKNRKNHLLVHTDDVQHLNDEPIYGKEPERVFLDCPPHSTL